MLGFCNITLFVIPSEAKESPLSVKQGIASSPQTAGLLAMTIHKSERFTTPFDGHADVSGGMGGKIDAIKTIAKLGINTILVNGNKPDRVYNVLVEENAKSTIIYGGRNEKN